jgi:DNA-binding protein H-NS
MWHSEAQAGHRVLSDVNFLFNFGELKMKDLISIQSQIKDLQEKASAIKAKEFDQTVRDILTKMAAFGITVKDLKAPNGPASKVGKKMKGPLPAKLKTRTGLPVAVKFRGTNGETWTGRGLTPTWLKAELANGKFKEDFAIKV